MNKIEELRKEIDLVDDEIVSLLVRRLSLVKEIGIEKNKNDIAILDSNREKQIKERIKSKLKKEDFKYIDSIYDSIFLVSKSFQNDNRK